MLPAVVPQTSALLAGMRIGETYGWRSRGTRCAESVIRWRPVAFCMFEANGVAMLPMLWEAARLFNPHAPDDARMPFRTSNELVALCEGAELRDVIATELSIEASYPEFDELWSPFAYGIGPAAEYLQAQDPARRALIREAYFDLLGRPAAAFLLPARVIAVRGRTAD